jgi:EAL domain-containing protein (putative c-di-GMP-specific phosphodiesterase class I)/CheY-like chemotaxis protein
MKRIILIADDSDIDRAILHKILNETYEVKEATNGREALALFHEYSLQLSALIADIHMPDIDGFSLIKAITSDPKWRQIPIIVASGEKDIKQQEEALRLGAMGFIEKPYNKIILLNTVNNAVGIHEMAALSNSVKRDQLTGLLNRTGFLEMASSLVNKSPANSYVITIFNFENFKLINDQYGTEAGDKLLKYTAKNIVDSFTELGTEGVVGRLNSDKFIVLSHKDMINNEGLEKYHKAVRNPPFLPQKVRFHLGRCLIDDISRPISNYIDRAFMAEETIKHEYGSFSASYDEKMLNVSLKRQEIAGAMVEALHQNEFVPYFQPQFNHEDGTLVGAEALVRWLHKGQLIPPDSFIPLFEQNGFIYEMDCSIWKQVCKALRNWINQGKNPVPVSVNISRYDLLHDNCQSFLLSLLKKYDLPIYLLRLEITESAFSSNSPVFQKIEDLIEAGFVVEIDDFGSGYSSLNSLKDIKASFIKIDMRFFERCADEVRSGTIVQFTVRLAKWLHMDVIAEGVETIAQADFLKSIGCFFIQGYLYSKPLPLEDYERLLRRGHVTKPLSSPSAMRLRITNINDPNSFDSWLFKTKAGPACILEIRGDVAEVMRVNDSYLKAISSVGIRVEDVLQLNWARYFDNETKRNFITLSRRISSNENDVPGVMTFLNMQKCPPKVVIKTKQTLIARGPDSIIVYCAVEFVTD